MSNSEFLISRKFGRRTLNGDTVRNSEKTLEAQPTPKSESNSSKSSFRFSTKYYDLRELVFTSLFQDIGHDQYESLSSVELDAAVIRHLTSAMRVQQTQLQANDIAILRRDVINDVTGYGPLEDLLHRDNITDIMVIGPKSVFYEENGQILKADVAFQNESHVRAVSQRIARRIGRRIDESSPMCDARLPDGSRVNIVVPPLSIDGTALTIRKFQTHRLNFDALVARGTIDIGTVQFLKWLVDIRCNIMVIGGTGSGKTTLLNCLNHALSERERIITCEDAAELQLQQPHIVRLETRPNNLEGSGEIPMRSLIRNSLRMRPDRIVVGEIRGEEAFDFVQAMNTGHDGSMGTMHANSSLDALPRLEGLISLGAPSLPSRTIQQMITSALDVIIEVRRMQDGSRRVSNLLEVLSWSESGIMTNPLLDISIAHSRDGRIDAGFDAIRARIMSERIKRKASHTSPVPRLDL